MSHQYIRVRFAKAGECYQEIRDGYVQRYVDDSGDVLFEQPPIGDKCAVIDADPVVPLSLLSAGDVRFAEAQNAIDDSLRAENARLRDELDRLRAGVIK